MNPENVAGLLARAKDFSAIGQLPEAEQLYRRALEIDADSVEANAQLGTVLARQGRLTDAAACYRRALLLQPTYVAAHGNLGNVLRQQGHLEAAADCYRRVLQQDPNRAEAHNDLGLIFQQEGRVEEAIDCYCRAIQLRPDFVQAHYNLGGSLANARQLKEAEACYRRVLALKPDIAEAHNNLGVVLMDGDQLDEALLCYRKAIELKPDYAEAYLNCGLALAKQNRIDDAVACCESALELRPDSAETHYSLAGALMECNRTDEALAHFRKSLALQPHHARSNYGYALALLKTGRFAEGWPAYEWRWKIGALDVPVFIEPRWTGEDLSGKTILVHCEQGLGDTLQFIRYTELLKQRGAYVLVACPPSLLSLIAHCPSIDKALDLERRGENKFDFHVPLLSLPGILGTTLESLPVKIPYIWPDPDLIERWKSKLGRRAEFRIGIVWQGNKTSWIDRRRSIPLRQFSGILRTRGVHVYSLQMGDDAEPIADLPITDLRDRPNDFHQTAAIMCNLDLVISCDSAPAHLAGALGVPVWVALSFAGDWRYLLDREDCPWYPTMRLFRQSRPGDWDSVFCRMEQELAKLL
jgi:tetratricopeptide (TPR) repeat protein